MKFLSNQVLSWLVKSWISIVWIEDNFWSIKFGVNIRFLWFLLTIISWEKHGDSLKRHLQNVFHFNIKSSKLDGAIQSTLSREEIYIKSFEHQTNETCQTGFPETLESFFRKFQEIICQIHRKSGKNLKFHQQFIHKSTN